MTEATTQQFAATNEGAALPPPGTYEVDPAHSTVSFVARHLVGSKVRGHFTSFRGTVTVAEDPSSSTVEAEVDAASIDTGVEQRDQHLRSGDFLEQGRYPTLGLRSTALSPSGADRWRLEADLTVRGVTRPVVFDLEYLGSGPGMMPDSTVAAFSAAADIDRRDFGVSFSATLDTGGLVVGNKVRIELDVEAVRK